MFFAGLAEEPEKLQQTLDDYIEEGEQCLRESELLGNVEFDGDWDVDGVIEQLGQESYRPEFWAVRLIAFSLMAKGACDRKEVAEAAWTAHRAGLVHCMFIYLNSSMDDLLWRGYRTFGLADLEAAVDFWESAEKGKSEPFWQEALKKFSFVISQIFAVPTVVIDDQPYIGGKGLENTGGNVADFLVKNPLTGALGIVEIKKPSTELLGKKVYRGGIHAPLTELVGAVSQAIAYRDSLVKEYYQLVKGTANDFPYDPLCVVIAGTTAQLDTPERRRSFELFRRGLKDVHIVTFDELFEQAKALVDLVKAHPEVQRVQMSVVKSEGGG